MEQTTVTTICALINSQDDVLFIDRRKSWPGLALPGGHIEGDESIHDCAIREVYEETGLKIKSLQFRGMTHFFNVGTNKRYLIFHFASRDFDGTLIEACDEGTLHWIPRSRFGEYEFAQGMAQRLPLFFDERISEYYVAEKEDGVNIRVQNDRSCYEA